MINSIYISKITLILVTIPAIPNLAPSAPAMGATRGFQTNILGAARRPIRTRPNQYSGSFNRRVLRAGKKMGLAVGKTKRGKGKIGEITDAAHIETASPHEVELVEDPVDIVFFQFAPNKIIGDKARYSDHLDERMLE